MSYIYLYFNASTISHFTNYNSFNSDYETLNIFIKKNKWISKYIKDSNLKDNRIITKNTYTKSYFIKSNNAIGIPKEVFHDINSNKGTFNETLDKEIIKNKYPNLKEIKESKSCELFNFDFNNTIYKVIVTGKPDGLINDEIILETKHRINKILYPIPSYDKVQLEMYLHIFPYSSCLYVQNFNNQIVEDTYYKNETFMEDIKKQIKNYIIEIFTKFKIC